MGSDLVTDSSDHLYQVMAKRIQGNGFTVYGTWYSEMSNGQWKPPMLIDPKNFDFYDNIGSLDSNSIKNLLNQTINDDGLRYQRTAILDGNELFVVVVNEYDGDIYSAHVLLDTPYVAPAVYPTPTAPPETPTVLDTPTQAVSQQQIDMTAVSSGEQSRPVATGSIFIVSTLIVAVMLVVTFVLYHIFHRN